MTSRVRFVQKAEQSHMFPSEKDRCRLDFILPLAFLLNKGSQLENPLLNPKFRAEFDEAHGRDDEVERRFGTLETDEMDFGGKRCPPGDVD